VILRDVCVTVIFIYMSIINLEFPIFMSTYFFDQLWYELLL